jgi:processive 1,2-diacylglycerol beta-glucosyltransferase
MVNHGVAETLSRAGMDLPLAAVLTDLAPPFWRGWAEPRAAVTTAATAEALDQLAAWGVPASRLRRAPIPIASRLQPASAGPRREALRDLGLQAGRLTVVFDAGTACRAAALRAYRAVAAAPDLAQRTQAIFLAGRDPRLLRRARGVPAPFPAAVLPWRDDLGTILAAADLLFTKPGALTIAEALAAGVPLLLDTCGGVMPQERGGARWVAAQGAGWAVEDPAALPRLLRDLPAEARAAARERALAAASGHAGTVLDRLEEAMGWGAAGSEGAALAAAGARA